MAEQLLAPMAGKVKEIVVKVGDRVEEDDPIITFEAMKMEMPLGAPVAGVVKEILVTPGQQLPVDTLVAVIE